MVTSTLARVQTDPRPLERYLAAFEAFEKAEAEPAPPWLRALRTSGISYLAQLGLPTSDLEDWRFTNPALLAQFPFSPAISPLPSRLALSEIKHFFPDGLETHRLVFVDGHFSPELSAIGSVPPGVTIGSLADVLREQPSLIESHLGRAARHETNAFAALNTAFLQDGAFLHLPPHQNLETPVHLLFLTKTPGAVNQPRNLFVAGPHSRLRVIEDYVSLGEAATFTNAVTEIFAGDNARLEHLKIQRENAASLHVATIECRQQRDSSVLTHSLSVGARLARHNIHLRLESQGCVSVLNGLYLADGERLVDHHTIADHLAPHCASHEFLHGILGGRARGVFNGRIFVHLDAQKTDARQTNRNLLLSDDATINSTPQLEIHADDVKCTHGATVGQLDDEALFYLRSRGIGENLARQMLIHAFASDIINRITIEPARAWLEKVLAERLSDPPATLPARTKPTPLGETSHV